jgi:hypothetical protein
MLEKGKIAHDLDPGHVDCCCFDTTSMSMFFQGQGRHQHQWAGKAVDLLFSACRPLLNFFTDFGFVFYFGVRRANRTVGDGIHGEPQPMLDELTMSEAITMAKKMQDGKEENTVDHHKTKRATGTSIDGKETGFH